MKLKNKKVMPDCRPCLRSNQDGRKKMPAGTAAIFIRALF